MGKQKINKELLQIEKKLKEYEQELKSFQSKELDEEGKNLAKTQSACLSEQRGNVGKIKYLIDASEETADVVTDFFSNGHHKKLTDFQTIKAKYSKILDENKKQVDECKFKDVKVVLQHKCVIMADCIGVLLNYVSTAIKLNENQVNIKLKDIEIIELQQLDAINSLNN